MSILNKIIAHKKEEVEVRKMILPENELKDSLHFNRRCLSLKESLGSGAATGIIAEFKRKSPSKGYINQWADAAAVTKAYTQNGASGLSVLTDYEFFGGNNEDLLTARENNIPVLRKEFIIDSYQLTEAKAIGADVVLLIAACLSVNEVKELSAYARQLGLEVLLELHDEEEMDHICAETDMVGINNRNLKTFTVDLQRSAMLAKMIPGDKIKIAESGISSVEDICFLKSAGYKGFLVGENFMKETDPGIAFRQFVQRLK